MSDRDTPRILVADDDVDGLEVLKTRLVHAGYDGYFDVKLMGEEIEASDYAELIVHSKDAFEQLTAAMV